MFTLVTPPPPRCRSIQEAETAWYWSAATEVVLRKHGLVGIDATGATRALPIVTRAAPGPPPHAPACREGPLDPDLAASLGLRVRPREAECLEILDAAERPLGVLRYPACTVRRIPADRTEAAPDPTPHVAREPAWNNRRIRFQACAPSSPWRVVAHLRADDRSEMLPAALSDGARLVFPIPLLDLLVSAHAFVPLDVPYYAPVARADTFAVEAWLVEQLLAHARQAGLPTITVRRWPPPWSSALTIRHDHDRDVPADALGDLLDFYDERDLRATWGLLSARDDAEVADLVERRGHEVTLHTAATDEAAFGAEVARRGAPAGYTTHGGRGAAGFRGQTQWTWAHRAGLAYGEIIGRANRLPHAAVVVEAGSVPRVTPLVLPAAHASLDAGTAPDAHRLDRLRRVVPAALAEGTHAVVMNHPDVHRAELRDLLGGLDLSRTWRATLHEVAAWTRAAKVASRVTVTPGGTAIEFAGALPQPATVVVSPPDGAPHEVVCDAGATSGRLRI